ncbi:MAG: G8 domain-containing protein [Pseudomonadales bacterium]|nr:G8 domain-containing protein [Pseudomonadales bacterium]
MTLITRAQPHLIFILMCCFGSLGFAATPLEVAGSATATAVSSGNWSADTTWGGAVPASGARVLIPTGITVTVDQKITANYKSLRIDGALTFSPDQDTELRAEFVVSSVGGRIEIGTASNPIPAETTARLTFVDLGGTTTAEDPERFAPGAVFIGPTQMHGASKTAFTTLAAQPAAGEQTLSLTGSINGWEVGDQLIVAGTIPGDFTSDEVVTIASIDGNNISLASPLSKAHQAPTAASDLAVHVANLTRNIKISSENPSVSAKTRGHLMFMHNLDVDLRYVEISDLGRTDKSIPVDDYLWDDLQEEASYQPPRGKYTNPRGRYSVHFHRGGFDPGLNAAHVEGVTVNNDPGWGYVNHSSRVDFIRNVSYEVTGGAFNTEAGDETGSFIENIAIRTVNTSDPFSNPRAEPALIDLREEFQDFAWQGDAFWFHSAGVTVQGNIASGVTGSAFVFWPEGLIENGLGMRRGTVESHITSSSQRAALSGVSTDFVLECWLIPSKPFINNTAYNMSKGVTVFYMHTRFLDTTEGKNNVVPETFRDTLNFAMEGTTLWNIRNKGIETLYSSHVSISDSRIVGYNSPSTAVGMDLDHWHNFDSWQLSNNDFEGFDNGNIALVTPKNAEVTISGGTFNNSSTDIQIKETNMPNPKFDEDVKFDQPNRTMTISDINFLNANRNLVLTADLTYRQDLEDGFDEADDEKFPLFFLMPDSITLNYGPFQQAKLYFDQQSASFVPLTQNALSSLPDEEDEEDEEETDESLSRYVGKSNAELQSLTNPSTSFGGAILPDTAVAHPTVIGGWVSAIVPDSTSPGSNDTNNNTDTSDESGAVDIGDSDSGDKEGYNGVSPDPELNLPTNTIDFFDTQNMTAFLCVSVLDEFGEITVDADNQQQYFNVTMRLISESPALLQVNEATLFNPNSLLTEFGEIPDCSGEYNLATQIYSNYIQIDDEVSLIRLKLEDQEQGLFSVLELSAIDN